MPQRRKDGDDGPTEMYSFASVKPPQFAEPALVERATARNVTPTDVTNYIAGTEARQGMFAAASGTLTQFNAIMVGLNGAALSTSEGALKVLIAVGLLSHVVAAFILCWAARPVVDERPSTPSILAAVSNYRHADDTFRNYRRGWRMTLLAIAVSSGAAVLFVLHAFGTSVSDIVAAWR